MQLRGNQTVCFKGWNQRFFEKNFFFKICWFQPLMYLVQPLIFTLFFKIMWICTIFPFLTHCVFSCRQRVMMQIVQELCKRPNLNRTGFDMPTIYIPNPNKTVRCVNQIDDVCRDIEKTINQTIQVIFFRQMAGAKNFLWNSEHFFIISEYLERPWTGL